MAATEGRVQFHTRVAVNALGMVERELTSDPSSTPPSAPGSRRCSARRRPADADDELAAGIRDGSLDDRRDDGARRKCGEQCARNSCREPGLRPTDVPSCSHAHRHLERQLAEGPAPPGRGVARYAEPDVLCLQETKLADKAFPQLTFQSLGYDSVHHGQGQWNGVAILSRVGVADVRRRVRRRGIVDPYEGDARLLAATCGGVRVVSVYVPNGREVGTEFYERKLAGFERLHDWIDAHVQARATRS